MQIQSLSPARDLLMPAVHVYEYVEYYGKRNRMQQHAFLPISQLFAPTAAQYTAEYASEALLYY